MKELLGEQMRQWETTGKIGDGPADVKAAATDPAKRGEYRAAVTLRYGFVTPTFEEPKTDAGVAEGPSPHADAFSSGEKKWRNYLDQYETPVSTWFRPNPHEKADWHDHVREIGERLVSAKQAGKRLRVIGAGHSASKVSKPDLNGIVLQVDDFNRVQDPPFLPPKTDTSELAWCGAGVRIVDLNKKLAARGQAMPNMGGYNGQTLAGALCTGTHGSGIQIPSLYGVIASIWVVVLREDGTPELRVVEPTAGLSSPGLFESAPKGPKDIPRRLIQDDATFQAVCLGMGWLGVVYAMTLRVSRSYWLRQTKEMRTFADALGTLEKDVASHHTFEWALSPMPSWQADGTWDHSCLTIRRDKVAPGTNPLWPTGSAMNFIDRLVGENPTGWTDVSKALQQLVGMKNLGAFVHNALASMQVKNFASAPPNILLLPYGNHFRAKSCELMFRFADTEKATRAVLRFIRKEAASKTPRVVNSPCGVRFVKHTPGPLSPFDWGDGSATTTMEIPIILDGKDNGWGGTNADDLLMDVFDYLSNQGIEARLHWGQYHRIGRKQMEKFYGKARVAAFEKVWDEFNPTGVTSSEVSDRLELGKAGGNT